MKIKNPVTYMCVRVSIFSCFHHFFVIFQDCSENVVFVFFVLGCLFFSHLIPCCQRNILNQHHSFHNSSMHTLLHQQKKPESYRNTIYLLPVTDNPYHKQVHRVHLVMSEDLSHIHLSCRYLAVELLSCSITFNSRFKPFISCHRYQNRISMNWSTAQ